MGKLVDVDDIDWQEGVFVTPKTKEPLPIIHKIATIEMLRDWQEEVKAIPLEKIKQVREEIKQNAYPIVYGVNNHDMGMTLNGIFQVLDKLIESEE